MKRTGNLRGVLFAFVVIALPSATWLTFTLVGSLVAGTAREVDISSYHWSATQKLRSIVLDSVEFQATPLRDAAASLVKVIDEKDHGGPWRCSFPDHNQVRRLFAGEPECQASVDPERLITFSLSDVHALEAVEELAQLGDCRAFFLDGQIFLIRPEAVPYREDSFDAYAQIRPSMAHLKVIDARPALEGMGIELPPGGWATYHVAEERLDVRGHGDDLEMVYALLHSLVCGPREYSRWELLRLQWNIFPPPLPKGRLDLVSVPYPWNLPSPSSSSADPISPARESEISPLFPATSAPPSK